jgi:hypothetical protein
MLNETCRKNSDPAFLSRISVAIKYSDLGNDARKAIWIKFLEMAKVRIISPQKKIADGPASGEKPTANGTDTTAQEAITTKDLKRWSEKPLNGRQVKQVCRAAQVRSSFLDCVPSLCPCEARKLTRRVGHGHRHSHCPTAYL